MAVEYQDPDDVMVSQCIDCPWTANDGHYIWCPVCGSSEVAHL